MICINMPEFGVELCRTYRRVFNGLGELPFSGHLLMKCLPLTALGILSLALPNGLLAQTPMSVEHLQQEDLRLARIAESMLSANRTLCRQTMPITGMVIHSRDQYGTGDVAGFENGSVAIALIVPGSAAEVSALQRGDAILAIGGSDITGLQPSADAPVRDAVFDLLAEQAPTEPLHLRIARAGTEFDVTLSPQAGCHALAEILADERVIARSDGRVIQVSYGLASGMSDDGLAAIFAHELAHSVLEHRRRLSEAGVSKGFLGEIGGDQQRNRQMEVEADRLSIHLLANAGLDPHIPVRFWLSDEGRRMDAGLLRSLIYPSPADRAAIMEREIADYLALGHGPTWPGHLLARRDRGS